MLMLGWWFLLSFVIGFLQAPFPILFQFRFFKNEITISFRVLYFLHCFVFLFVFVFYQLFFHSNNYFEFVNLSMFSSGANILGFVLWSWHVILNYGFQIFKWSLLVEFFFQLYSYHISSLSMGVHNIQDKAYVHQGRNSTFYVCVAFTNTFLLEALGMRKTQEKLYKTSSSCKTY